MRQYTSFRTFQEFGEYVLAQMEKSEVKVGKLEMRLETLEILQKRTPRKPVPVGDWLNVDELLDYLPDKPALSTVYGWVGHKQIPFYKSGKKLRFLKSEIDKWLLNGKTTVKAENEV